MKKFWRKIISLLAVFLLVINILTLPAHAVLDPLSKIPEADGSRNNLKAQEKPGQVRTIIDPDGKLRLSTLPNIPEKMLNQFQGKYLRGSTPGVDARKEKPKSKGYIIEFKNQDLSSFQVSKQQKGETGNKLRDSTLNYKKELQKEHETAKKDILSRLNKNSFQAPKKEAKNAVVILQEYTTLFNGIALNITEDQVNEIKKSRFVKNISPNYEVKMLLSESVPIIQADSAWQLKDPTKKNVTGQGTTIAIIDTGIDYTHPDLGGCLGANCKVIGGYDFVNYDNDPLDDQGHGTHVAAIAAGKPSSSSAAISSFGGGPGGPTPTPAPSPTSTPCPSSPFVSQDLYGGGGPNYPIVPCPNTSLYGVAPEAKLVAFKVLDNDGSGYWSDVITAIERSLDPNQDGDFSDHYTVANLSLGANCYEYTNDCGPDDLPSKTIDNAVNAGLPVVVAAGNSGYYSNGSIITPGTSRKAITVGATDKYNSLAWFSSKGPVVWKNSNIAKPDVVAPGVGICAAGKFFNYYGQDISRELRCVDQNHIRLSGTSMATPHVAGAIALIKQAHPNWSSTHLKAVLKNTAQSFDTTSPIDRGAGRINSLLSVRETHPFPLANLEPITFDSSSNTLKGRISALNLKFWSLSYTPKSIPEINLSGEINWTELYRSTTPQHSMTNLYTLPIPNLPDGEYAIRLYAENNKGQKGVDYGYVNIDKLTIASPLDSDVWRAGDNLPINITLNPAVLNKEFTFEYARLNTGNAPDWQLIAKTQNTNYNWNAQGLETGLYVTAHWG